MKQSKKLTYSLKQKLDKMGKDVSNYRLKENLPDGSYLLINVKTNKEIVVH